jgi:hypothetical protein
MRSVDLITKIRGSYLRNELRYDKWGAQGKLLVAKEVLAGEGVHLSFPQLRWLVNSAFPRTFACCRPAPADPAPVDCRSVASYFMTMRSMFFAHGMGPRKSEGSAIEETAEKFCLSPGQVTSWLRSTIAG